MKKIVFLAFLLSGCSLVMMPVFIIPTGINIARECKQTKECKKEQRIQNQR